MRSGSPSTLLVLVAALGCSAPAGPIDAGASDASSALDAFLVDERDAAPSDADIDADIDADDADIDADDADIDADIDADDADVDADIDADDAWAIVERDAGPDDAGILPEVPTNEHPTARALALFRALARTELASSALFGQQHAFRDGYFGTLPNDGRLHSDVFDAIAARRYAPEHPALVGWNVEALLHNRDADDFRARLIAADRAGAITTLHWPMPNLFIGCAREETCAVCSHRLDDNCNDPAIDPIHAIAHDLDVPGGNAGALFDAEIDSLATYLRTLTDDRGEPIPILLRPFHEMNNPRPGARAHWWTGRDPAEYAAVWRRVVDRLRAAGVDQVLYVYAPRGELITHDPPETNTLPELEARYATYWPETGVPRDARQRYVDVAAFDLYLLDPEPTDPLGNAIDASFAFAEDPARVVPRVVAIAEIGRKNGTSAATTGGTSYQDGPFWAERVQPVLDADGGARWRRIAYMMTWANGTDTYFTTHPCRSDGTDCAPDAADRDFASWFLLPQTAFLAEAPSF